MMIKILIFSAFLAFISFAEGKLNLIVPPEEVEKVLGISRTMAYVRDGVVMRNAANFKLFVPENLDSLHFLWWAAADSRTNYSIVISHNDKGGGGEGGGEAMYQPHINVSHSGQVPGVPSVFRISLPCTGRVNAEVNVDIRLRFNVGEDEELHLHLQREKSCTSDFSEASALPEEVVLKEGKVQPHLVFLASFLSAIAAMTCTVICIAIVHLKVGLVKVIKAGNQFNQVQGHKGTFNTIVSSKSNEYEPVGQEAQNLLPVGIGYTETGLVTMNPRPAPPPPPPPGLPAVQRFDFPATGFPSDAESRVTDWVNQQQVRGPMPEPKVEEESEDEDVMLIAKSIFESLQVERPRLKLGSLLQEGTFGRVYQGLFQTAIENEDPDDTDSEKRSADYTFVEEDIMVKTVLTGSSQVQSQLLVQESVQLLWNRRSSLSNASRSSRHVLAPLAGTWDGTSPMIIYPYPAHGNLKQYLTKFASAGLSTHQVVRLGTEMLSALAHIHKKKVIHKDVAARNCFLGEDQTLLLADASLSRDLFPGDYHCLGDNENRPLKWMPIESITGKSYSKASDVWSFGVFMWELMTKAQQPFADIDPFEMESYLNEGYRLHQPMNCPDQLYSILAACWATMPHERANVQSLQTTLQWLQKQLQQFV